LFRAVAAATATRLLAPGRPAMYTRLLACALPVSCRSTLL